MSHAKWENTCFSDIRCPRQWWLTLSGGTPTHPTPAACPTVLARASCPGPSRPAASSRTLAATPTLGRRSGVSTRGRSPSPASARPTPGGSRPGSSPRPASSSRCTPSSQTTSDTPQSKDYIFHIHKKLVNKSIETEIAKKKKWFVAQVQPLLRSGDLPSREYWDGHAGVWFDAKSWRITSCGKKYGLNFSWPAPSLLPTAWPLRNLIPCYAW